VGFVNTNWKLQTGFTAEIADLTELVGSPDKRLHPASSRSSSDCPISGFEANDSGLPATQTAWREEPNYRGPKEKPDRYRAPI